MPEKPGAVPKSPSADAVGRIARVSLEFIDGLHPAIARERWLGGEYVVNDLTTITAAALAQVLRTHPVLLTEVAPGRKRRRRRGGRDESATEARPAGAPIAASRVAEARDTEELQGGDNDNAVEAESDAEVAARAPADAIATTPRYVVVGGLRSWALANAVSSRRVPGRCGKPLRVPALIVAALEGDAVVIRVRAERYLDHLLYSLKPATAARQLAEDWKEFQEHAASELRGLTPTFTSQQKFIAALGYASRSAFRSQSQSSADASWREGPTGDAAKAQQAGEAVPVNELATGTTEPSAPRVIAPEVDHPHEGPPSSAQEDGHG